MKTPENDDRLQQELRVAQLEIKALREQLLEASKAAQQTRAREEEPPEPSCQEAPEKATEDEGPNGTLSNGAISHNRRVLYVEDSEPNFHLIESILNDRPDTDLLWAETGEKGLELAGAHAPQLILLDLDLPDMHGSQVLERLQADPATAQTPVIVISADATPSQIERMLAAGARDYLTKPFEIRRFLFMFDEVFATLQAVGHPERS
jgi:CheY-like chemotaxis protein